MPTHPAGTHAPTGVPGTRPGQRGAALHGFDRLSAAGVPAGPLTAPISVHQRSGTHPDGRSHLWHCDEHCDPLVDTHHTIAILDLDPTRCCRSCFQLPALVESYLSTADELLTWRAEADHIATAGPTALRDTWDTPESPAEAWWLVCTSRAHQLRVGLTPPDRARTSSGFARDPHHPLPEAAGTRQAWAQLTRWAQAAVAPVLATALAVLAGPGGPAWVRLDDWAERIAWTRTRVGDTGWEWPYRIGLTGSHYPALVPLGMLLSELQKQGGQAGIPALMRQAAIAGWRDGDQLADIKATMVSLARNALSTQDGPLRSEQVPADAPLPPGTYATIGEATAAAWHQLARTEIDALATTLIEALCPAGTSTDSFADPEETAACATVGDLGGDQIVVWSATPVPTLAAAMVYSRAVCVTAGGALVTIMPTAMVNAITPTLDYASAVTLQVVWCASEAGDDVEVLTTAVDLLDRGLVSEPASAVAAARGALG